MRFLPALLALLTAAPAQQRPAEQPATFKTSVNLVTVPVVVRDNKGKPVGGLRRESFQLFDNGKPQEIAKFSVERIGGAEGQRKQTAPARAGGPPPTAMPDRFVAYLFDDLHLKIEDLIRIRQAAARHFSASLRPGDRAAIYTTSGQTMLEFTSDRDRLDATLKKLMPRPIGGGQSGFDCPDIGFYQADLILNHHDQEALDAAISELLVCSPGIQRDVAVMMVQQHARQVLEAGELQTRVAFNVVRDVIRRMSSLPGQRSIVLASPGFLAPDLLPEESDLIDRAIRGGVVISAIDARGLWVDPSLDASKRTISMDALRVKSSIERASASLEANILAELASGTGGRFFQNNNDLDEGLQQVAAAPEYVYLLAFSPLNLKMDGKYHNLKVALTDAKGVTPEARKGYFAPKSVADPAQQAKQEIYDAVFSRGELNELPVEVGAQFFRPRGRNARLAVLARVPLKGLRFRKVDDRNCDEVTVVSSVFDGDGNLVAGQQQHFNLRLKDETVAKKAESGFTGRTSFDLPAGSYLIRVVVRDGEGRISARNRALEIPASGLDALLESVIHQFMAPAGETRAGSLRVQAPFFYSAGEMTRVRVAAEIPARSAESGEVVVTGSVYAPDGTLAAWFSNTAKNAPVYEDQFDVAPGQYNLQLVFRSEGDEIGSVDAPLHIERREAGQFALSGIGFSKEYREVLPEEEPDRSGDLDGGSGPLVTQDYEYPLAGARRFRPTDRVAVYFVMYEPRAAAEGAPGAPDLIVSERVLERATGEPKWDSGPTADATKYLGEGASMIALGLKLPVQFLAPGEYRLEVKAADPAGRTATRTADFDVW
ncbi:MAG: VWA domain-containing protein [Acidobacteriia bacterium]|nr:VWA domain-containing protein [Terriglobia bacterium]